MSGDDIFISDLAPHHLYGGTGNDLYSLPFKIYGGVTIIDDSGTDDRIVIRSFDGTADMSSFALSEFMESLENLWDGVTGVEFLQAEDSPDQIWSWGQASSEATGIIRGVPIWLSESDSYVGSTGDDILVAMNGWAAPGQTIDAGIGNDIISGTDAADTLIGGGGHDRLLGGAGDDHLSGGTGDDILTPGQGVDHLDGGLGIDTVDYSLSGPPSPSAGVRVDLSRGRGVGGNALDDVYVSIENVVGTGSADILIGDGRVNRLSGGDGNDTLIGGAGADMLDGGSGFDTISYSNASTGVQVFLTTMRGGSGDAQGDTYSGIEAVNGSQFNDMLFSGSSTTGFTLNGLDGDDVLFAAITVSKFIGGAGFDTLSYSAFTSRVVVSLDPEDQLGSAGRADLISEIEGLNGSQADDLLYGNSGANALGGLGGDDVLLGGGGGDALDGGAGLDTASYTTARAGIRADLAAGRGFTGDAQGDTYLAIEALNGSNFDDLLLGDNAANTLKGMNGDDRLAGRGGVDLLTGGNGADRFVYSATTESRVGPGNRDIILDFSHAQGDRIDLANIDARPADAGDQAFRFLGTDAFDGNAGALRYINAGSYSVIEIDTNGDRVTDMQIQVNGINSFVAGDFIL
ncbi:hypothetical protein WG926_08365 [Tistrella sp. BH-R2-4]|uniref:Peptidase M10 serralysin C-terminal domain-containing protein n=1 Tax=Tistrella arctica TaxID=3133430 RepID=A0ABU9YHX0_9PROT